MADLLRLKRDVSYFADQIGQPLTDWQADSVALETLITVIVGGRQLGKSRTLAVLAVWWAARNPGQLVLIISAGESSSRRLLAQIRRMATAAPLLSGAVVDEQAALVRLANGSEIRSLPSTSGQIRGWSTDLLIIDEAGSPSSDVILSAALPTVTARANARVVLADAAWAASGAFYDLAVTGEQGGEQVRTYRWVSTLVGGPHEAPWVTPSIIEVARATLGELRFAAEYEGRFATGGDRLFTRAALERVLAPVPLLGLHDLRGPGRLLGGVDWGAVSDKSAIGAWGRVPIRNELPAIQLLTALAWPSGTPLNSVIKEIAASPAHWAGLAAERNGLGEPCVQDLARLLRSRPDHEGGGRRRGGARVIEAGEQLYGRRKPPSAWDPARRAWRSRIAGVTTSAPMKAAAYSELRLLIDRGQAVIPAGATELLRELTFLEVELTQHAEKIHAQHGGHDDLADACGMLGLNPIKRPDGRWGTIAGLLLDPRRRQPKPEPAVPDDVPTVRTPGGIVVPATPIYQSVSGSDVTGFAIKTGPQPERVGDFLIHPKGGLHDSA